LVAQVAGGAVLVVEGPMAEDDTESWQGELDVGVRVCLKMRRQFSFEVGDLMVQLGDDADCGPGGRGECGGDRLRISPRMVRMWVVALDTSPVPASSLERSIAAPSVRRRSASPRLVAPHTNADAGLGHHGDGDRGDDALDHVRIAHPRHATLGANVGGDAFQGHDCDGTCALGNSSLLWGDDVHDDAALEHFGHPVPLINNQFRCPSTTTSSPVTRSWSTGRVGWDAMGAQSRRYQQLAAWDVAPGD
jgi:hypothetical protein